MNMPDEKKHVEIFCCYAREDYSLLVSLRKQLKQWERQNLITIRADTDIALGTSNEEEILQYLNMAHIILLLVSSDFINSEYCYSQMKRAMERYEQGETHVIPIILRPVNWQQTPFGKLQAFPNNPPTVAEWRNKNKAFLTIAQEIERTIIEKGLIAAPIDWQKPHNPLRNTTSIYDPATPSSPFDTPQDFVGRDEKLADIKKRLLSNQSIKLTALNGLPGVGKTALAIELVHTPEIQEHFYDGILWAGVGNKPNIREILDRWGELLGLNKKERASLSSDKEWALAIRKKIGRRHMLLVIDDIWRNEDVLAFQQLGDNACRYLITTRFLSIADSFGKGKNILVEELREADGVALLERFVPEIVKADPQGILKLEKAVGGLPLALKLIGLYLRDKTRHNTLDKNLIAGTLKELREAERRLQLEEEKGVLNQYPSLPGKSPLSLQAVIEVSYTALNDDTARQSFRGFSVFPSKPNTFSEAAALAVANTSRETFNYLVDAGLVEFSRLGRYTLHQTIFDFANLKRIMAEKRMAEYFANHVDLLNKTSEGELEDDETNISQALEFAHKHGYNELIIRICIGMQQFWHNRGHVERSLSYLPWAIAAAKALSRETGKSEDLLRQADLAQAYGVVLRRVGELDKAIEVLEANLAIRHEAQDFNGEGSALSTLGRIAHTRGRIQEAEEYCQKALAIHRERGNQKEEGVDLSSLGQIAQTQRDFVATQSYYERSLAIRIERKDERGEGMDLCFLGMVKLARGLQEDAEHDYKNSLKILLKIHEQGYEGVVRSELGYLAYLRGQYKDANRYYQEALTIVVKGNDRLTQCGLFPRMADLEATKGNLEEAEKLYRQGLDVSIESGYIPNIADALLALGSFLIEKKNQREEGCPMLLKATQHYHTMGIFRETEAREKLEQFGCEVSQIQETH
jgi:tetratricopeptide (TPR) repeat protein